VPTEQPPLSALVSGGATQASVSSQTFGALQSSTVAHGAPLHAPVTLLQL